MRATDSTNVHEIDVDELDDCGKCASQAMQHDSMFNNAKIVVNEYTNAMTT